MLYNKNLNMKTQIVTLCCINACCFNSCHSTSKAICLLSVLNLKVHKLHLPKEMLVSIISRDHPHKAQSQKQKLLFGVLHWLIRFMVFSLTQTDHLCIFRHMRELTDCLESTYTLEVCFLCENSHPMEHTLILSQQSACPFWNQLELVWFGNIPSLLFP